MCIRDRDYFIASLADRDLELKIREREPRDLETAFRHAVRLEVYDRVVESNYYPEQQKLKGGRNKYEDGLARKVTQLESKLEQVRNQKTCYVRQCALNDSCNSGEGSGPVCRRVEAHRLGSE